MNDENNYTKTKKITASLSNFTEESQFIFTWNFIFRVNNTEWTDDALRKYFANTKTDQKGTQSKYPRHIYTNPIEWVLGKI